MLREMKLGFLEAFPMKSTPWKLFQRVIVLMKNGRSTIIIVI